jgi:hypothetical protein
MRAAHGQAGEDDKGTDPHQHGAGYQRRTPELRPGTAFRIVIHGTILTVAS